MNKKKETYFYFDPFASGTAVFMGHSEARLMDLLWRKKTLTVKNALFSLEGKPRPAYTTVMTTLGRMADKGHLKKKKTGRSFVYSPVMSKEKFFKEKRKIVSTCLKDLHT